MMCVAFQVQTVIKLLQDIGFARACHAAQNLKMGVADGLFQVIQQKATHSLVAAHYAGIGNACLFAQPGLCDLAAQATSKAIQVAVGMVLRKLCPGLQASLLELATDQLVTQGNGGILAMLLVADPHQVTLLVVHQWQVQCAGKGAFTEFDGSASVHQRHIVQEQLAVVVGIRTHQAISTAWVLAGMNSPMASRVRPSSCAVARNSAVAAGSTAISKPPLVCGSHRMLI